MRVLIAPDKFAGTLGAAAAAEAIAEGWRQRCPGDELSLLPLSDGGPGFAEVMAVARGGERLGVEVTGPEGASVPAEVVVVREGDGALTAYVEAAQAQGLHLIPPTRRDPSTTTSAGVGELVLAAARAGAGRVVVGLGGSGTNDAGAGLLAALGAIMRDSAGRDISERMRQGAVALPEVVAVDLRPAQERVAGIDLVAATDVDNPLLGPRGASRGFAAQKHADPARVLEVELDALDARLSGFAAVIGRRDDGRDPAVALGAGAAGGVGYALLALGGRRVPGIATVLEAVELDQRISQADLVVTGEGSFDWQSLRGKVVSGVAAAALAQARPVVVLAGRVDVGRREYTAVGISAAFSASEQAGSEADSMSDPARWLAAAAERAAGTWGG